MDITLKPLVTATMKYFKKEILRLYDNSLKMKRYFYLIRLWFPGFLMMASAITAQDIHFSQYSSSPLNLAPSNSGMFDGDYRVSANFRDQWRVVPVPYTTVSLGAEMRNRFKYIQGDYTGAGVLFNYDLAGDSKFTTTQFYIPVSYLKKIGSDSNLFIGIGVAPGVSNINFRTDKLKFDNQYDGDSYNAALPTGENFPALSKTYFDANASLGFQYLFRPRAWMIVSAAFSHLNSPNVSFFKDKNIRLDLKQAYYAGVSYPVAPKLDWMAELFYERQGKYQETVPGTRISYILSFKDRTSVNLGFYYRLKDAFIGRVGMKYKNLELGLSYDINVSKFIPATNRRGGVEASLIYIFKKTVPFIAKKRACPIYM
jgi:type IX secretion system PorP/SprF family membrane protein